MRRPFAALSLVAVALLAPACGDEEGDITVSVLVERTSIDRTQSSTLQISVLREGRAVELGTSVRVLCLNGLTGDPAGTVEGGEGSVGIVRTDSLGIASARVSCGSEPAEEFPLLCRVSVTGASPTNALPITCAPLT